MTERSPSDEAGDTWDITTSLGATALWVATACQGGHVVAG
jgi:predicted O-methyltransferase YrrM